MLQKLKWDFRGKLANDNSNKHVNRFLENMGYDCFHDIYQQNSLGLSVFKFSPKEKITVEEKMIETNFCVMSFCLGESLEFSIVENPSKQLTIENIESCMIRRFIVIYYLDT